MKKGQISTEYLIIVGFITFVIISIMGVAFIYTTSIKDRIKMNQAENFVNKIISSAESIFFAGEPSKVEIVAYVPEGVTNITFYNKEVILYIETNSGVNVRSFPSRVKIVVNEISSSGVKKLILKAQDDKVTIT